LSFRQVFVHNQTNSQVSRRQYHFRFMQNHANPLYRAKPDKSKIYNHITMNYLFNKIFPDTFLMQN